MKTKQNLSIICMMLLISSCKDCKQCKTFTQCPTAPVILEYFGNYKLGNYWIYENQDGTKRDSMWVSNYIESELVEPNECINHPVRKFVLHTEYWTPTKLLNCKIDNEENCNMTDFVGNDSLNIRLFGVNSKNLEELPASTINEFYLSSIGIRKFSPRGTIDTFTLIKYYIQ